MGGTDLNLLNGHFLEKNRGNPGFVKEVIGRNRRARRRLIFNNHDISEAPSPYARTPAFFEDVVQYSLNSGARILPVAEARDAILADL
jgi:hypothetical protein